MFPCTEPQPPGWSTHRNVHMLGRYLRYCVTHKHFHQSWRLAWTPRRCLASGSTAALGIMRHFDFGPPHHRLRARRMPCMYIHVPVPLRDLCGFDVGFSIAPRCRRCGPWVGTVAEVRLFPICGRGGTLNGIAAERRASKVACMLEEATLFILPWFHNRLLGGLGLSAFSFSIF